MNLPLFAGNAIMAAFFLFTFNRLPPQIPLLYSNAYGESQLTDLWFIVIVPLLMNGFVFVNNYLTGKYFYEDDFVKKAMRYVNYAVIICCTLLFARILFLVS
jgi:hypothetical protein